jgi:hypothetical protein
VSDLQIDATTGPWDLTLVDGDVVLVHEVSRAAEVAQRVVYALMTWRGESVYDRGVGLPYLDGIFGFEPLPGIAALLSQTILDVEGVTEIIGPPDYILDGGTLSYSVVIRVDDGTETQITAQVGS